MKFFLQSYYYNYDHLQIIKSIFIIMSENLQPPKYIWFIKNGTKIMRNKERS